MKNNNISSKNLLFLYRYPKVLEDKEETKSSDVKKPYGLLNSSNFLINLFRRKFHYEEAYIENCIDSNDIDRFVTKHKPKVVILEALWCNAEKFQELIKLHPNVKWVIRIHSHFSFLANEGYAMKLIHQIQKVSELNSDKILFAGNDKSFCEGMSLLFPNNPECIHLPNYYWIDPNKKIKFKDFDIEKSTTIRIGCFGALRIMKNHLMQLVGATIAGKKLNKKIEFYINENFTQDTNNSVLNNIVHFCSERSPDEISLIHCPWETNALFLENAISKVDLNCQVSFSETFNFVSADSVVCGIPCLVGRNIPWITNDDMKVNEQDAILFAEKIISLLTNNDYRKKCWEKQLEDLNVHNSRAERVWIEFIKKYIYL